jgi:hypothetical protein
VGSSDSNRLLGSNGSLCMYWNLLVYDILRARAAYNVWVLW